MKIKNINEVLHTSGSTDDIIDAVMYAYEIEKDVQIREFAQRFVGKDKYQTCKNIWAYLVDNIRYKADSSGTDGEMIRTPARLIHDKTGDCKSYSLFTAVILRYLGIPHFFRFVSYNKQKKATHVYVVACNNIVIDAVATAQLKYPFDKEVKYTYRADMAERGTKISYLAGIPVNSVGAFTPLSDALRKAGLYFIYLFIPDSELKNYPPAVARKKQVQRNLFNIIHKVDIFHSREKVLSLFREGIKNHTGMSPEKYIDTVTMQNVLGKTSVGEPIIATVSAILGILIMLIQVFSILFPNSKITNYNYKEGVPDLQNELFTTPSGPVPGGTSKYFNSSNTPLLLGAGILVFYIFSKNK